MFRTLRAWQFDLALGSVLDRHRDQVKPSLAANIEQGRALSGADLARAEVLHAALFHRIREFFTRYDLLVLPVSQVPPFPIDQEYLTEVAGQAQPDYLAWMRSAYLVSATGHPALSVPGGFTPDRLPVGLQIIGPRRGELAALRAGHAFEQATGVGLRRPDLTI